MIKIILKKELCQYFHSPIGYIFIGVFLLMSGYTFVTVNLFSQNGDIKVFFASIFSVLLFIIPILTMRLFSEEKKMRTDQLLFTAPVSTAQIVAGKFLGAFAVFCIALAGTLLYPIILRVLGSFDLLETLGTYVGILLAAAAFISVGLFISALTENQVIAAVITYSVLLLLWLSDSASVFIKNATVKTLVRSVSFSRHYAEFTYGIANPAGIVFFLSVVFLFLYLSAHTLNKKRK